MSSRPFVHSYSAGKLFDQCNHRFHEDRVLRRFPFVQSPEAKEGDRIHKLFEEFVRDGTPFPKADTHLLPLGEAMRDKPGTKLVEQKWGLRKDWSPCGYFDDDVYYRYRNDYAAIHKSRAVLLDIKTGKDKYPDTDQLLEGAVILMQHYEQVQEVVSGLVFTKTERLVPANFSRDYLGDYLDQMTEKYGEIDVTMAQGIYPKKSGPLCPWCPVTECEFWRPKPERK